MPLPIAAACPLRKYTQAFLQLQHLQRSLDGRTIRGTWTAFYRGTEGLLDCTTTPPKDSAGWEARRYCPA